MITDSTLCGPQNGTFLCPDGSCIFETWLCDKTDDCVGGADEQNCDGRLICWIKAFETHFSPCRNKFWKENQVGVGGHSALTIIGSQISLMS